MTKEITFSAPVGTSDPKEYFINKYGDKLGKKIFAIHRVEEKANRECAPDYDPEFLELGLSVELPLSPKQKYREIFLYKKIKKMRESVVRVISNNNVVQIRRSAPQNNTGVRGASARSAKKSGDGNSDDGDPDPAAHALQLFDQRTFAPILGLSLKTLQNQYSKNPDQFPPAIRIPGARGPRWTVQAIQEWLSSRPAYSPPPPVAEQPPRRGRGRPRIALAARKAGGAA